MQPRPLRADLNLMRTAPAPNGAPAWILHDPVAHRFHRFGWLQFEILRRWCVGPPERIARDIGASTTLRPTAADVEALGTYLTRNDLLDAGGAAATQRAMERRAARGVHPLRWAIRNYLFVRIPLVRPDRALDRLHAAAAPLFRPAAAVLLVLAALAGATLVLRDWSAFLAGFGALRTPTGVIVALVALLAAKILHELGHALAAKHHGCRVPAMGVAFVVLWPLLWTDTTEGWKLRDRRGRLWIDGGGMVAELGLAALASLLWAVSPEGAFKMAMHVLASVAWITTLFVNLNPLMRFDGYYLLADAADIPNLQARSFALARWWVRRTLFGPEGEPDPPPEDLSANARRWLVVYAVATWAYRFVLFLGIALLVYQLAFKALGVILFVVEIWHFIARPAFAEMRSWGRGVRVLARSWRGVAYCALLAGAGYLLLAPRPMTLAFPAMIDAARTVEIVAPEPARVAAVPVRRGDSVAAGATVAILASPAVEHEIARARARRDTLRTRLAQTPDARAAAGLRDALTGAETELDLLRAQRDALTMTSAIAGIVRDLPDHVAPGQWVARREVLAVIESPDRRVTAYIPFAQRDALDEAAAVTVLHDGDPTRRVQANWERIDTTPVAALDAPALASIHGGPVPATAGAGGAPVPTGSWFRATARYAGSSEAVEDGTATVLAPSEPLRRIERFLRRVVSVLVRESGL